MIKQILTLLLGIIFCTGVSAQKYTQLSYLDIKVDSMGNMPRNPYIVSLKNNNKQLTVIGTQHSRDPLMPMFKVIENTFKSFNPDIIINEGGNLYKSYFSRNQAIVKDGELGLEKFMADNAGIKTVNGDEPDKQEFEELSAAFSKDEALVFFASERFIFPFAFGQYTGDLKTQYETVFIKGYLEKEHIALTDEEKKFEHYTTLYKKYFNQDFSLDNINQLNFIPFSRRNHFNDVTRKSKELRDRFLLKQIDAQLKLHNKVMVIYGGWHVMAIEPALYQIMHLK